MATDSKLKKSDEVHATRNSEDRTVTEDRKLTDDDRVEMFRQQFFQSALPDLPEIPGYHVCWLTTTNPRDPIHARIRLGYEPIKSEDVPGWEYASVKTGEYQGFVGVNEMLAFKLPESLYQRFMTEAHHNEPLHEEKKLLETAEQLANQAQASGSNVSMGDGMTELKDNRSAKFD